MSPAAVAFTGIVLFILGAALGYASIVHPRTNPPGVYMPGSPDGVPPYQ